MGLGDTPYSSYNTDFEGLKTWSVEIVTIWFLRLWFQLLLPRVSLKRWKTAVQFLSFLLEVEYRKRQKKNINWIEKDGCKCECSIFK